MGQAISIFFTKAKPVHVVMLGFYNAGKTTILEQLKLGEIITSVPLIAFDIETINNRNIVISSWDIHPHAIRRFWSPYFKQAQAIIFVIDLSDSRFCQEGLIEIKKLFINEDLQNAIFLIFANKMDIAVIKVEEFIECLQIEKVKQKCHIELTCATTGQGLKQGMDWLEIQMKVN